MILGNIRFNGGIGIGSKEGGKGSFRFARNLNIFDEPSEITLNPKTAKVSGATVVDLVKWIVSGVPNDTSYYFYGDTGHIYKQTSALSWSDLRTVASSNGQGFELHDDYLYYTQNTQIGRYGPLSGSPSFTDNWQTGLNDTSTTKFAPVKAFKEGFAVGHGNNLGWWDGTVWQGTRLTLPKGYAIRCLEVIDEYLVMGAWKGTSLSDSEEGIILFWDGTATTFNEFKQLPEGGFNALLNSRNRLFSIAGSSGYIYLNYNPFLKVHRIPKLPISKTVEVFPGAVTNWKGIVHFGISSTDSATAEHGVYQWGSGSDAYPEALNCGYTISTGTTTGTGVQIGSVKGIGDELYIGWKDGSTYGVDRVVQTAAPFTTGYIESLIFDNKNPFKDKHTPVLVASHKALLANETITLGSKVNRASSFTNDTANSTDDSRRTRLNVNTQFEEIEFRAQLDGTTTAPTLTGLALEFKDDERELV